MTDTLPEYSANRMSGEEQFHLDGSDLGLNALDFWAWSSSDLLNNTKRGVLAEFLVASSLKVANDLRIEWDPYDLTTENGIRVEVKSAAYLQSWEQDRPSAIRFSVAETLGWNEETGTRDSEYRRQSDVYVFCLLKHRDMNTVDPMNLSQWVFYVVSTNDLDEQCGDLKTLSLSRLKGLSYIETSYSGICDAINKVT